MNKKQLVRVTVRLMYKRNIRGTWERDDGWQHFEKCIDVYAASFYSVGVEGLVLYALRYTEGVGGAGMVS